MSDREKDGLRGSVKTVSDEQTTVHPDGTSFTSTTSTEYSADGRILQRRHQNSDGSEWVTAYTYSADGRLLKISSGDGTSAPSSEETYLYDKSNRLIGTESGDRKEIRYQYDDTGSKTMVETYDLTPLPPNTGYSPHWEATDLGFVPLPGGKLVTSYNKQGVATGAKLYDAKGEVAGRIERQFDSKGRITAEQQSADAQESLVPEELRSQLNPEQLKSVAAFAAAAFSTRNIVYSYDSQGRIVETRSSGGVLGEQITAVSYNEHGDKVSETSAAAMNLEVGREYGITETGKMIPQGNSRPAEPPSTYEVRYTYEYDSRGNWTEQTMSSRPKADEPFAPSVTHRRKLTYY